MREYLQVPLEGIHDYLESKESIRKKQGPVSISGTIDTQKVHIMAGLGQSYAYTLVITSDAGRAREIYEDFLFFRQDVFLFPAKDVIFYSADVQGKWISQQRLTVYHHMLMHGGGVIVTTVDAIMNPLLPLPLFREFTLALEEGQQADQEEVIAHLLQIGYENVPMVMEGGQFARRGGILDVFPLTEEVPYRVEFWGDEIDSIRTFSAETQRSLERQEKLQIFPASEVLLTPKELQTGLNKICREKDRQVELFRKKMKTEEASRLEQQVKELELYGEMELGDGRGLESYIRYFHDRTCSFISYFPEENRLIFVEEPVWTREKAKAVETEFRESISHRLEKGYILPGQANLLMGEREVMALLQTPRTVALSALDQKFPFLKIQAYYHIATQSIPGYKSGFERLLKDLKLYQKEKYGIVLISPSRTRGERLAGDLLEYDISASYRENRETPLIPGELLVTYGQLHKGFVYPDQKFVLMTEGDLFGEKKRKKRGKTTGEGQKISGLDQLVPGDYVIHENHGIGVYQGIHKVEVEKTIRDYIKITYGDGGNLYVPVTQFHLVQKYAGAEGRKPKLNRLGTQEWHKTKTRVRAAVQEIAEDLVRLYAARQAREGFAYSTDTVWQKEFEEMFPYEETQDQLDAIEATKKDMESHKIMDRLICGDVGYGKTEVAIRAAFKAVQDGKQVVCLVPTTILAQQHFHTFTQRMKDYPVRIDLLSRFRTTAEIKKTLADLKKGLVDIVIGTHRVLSKDVQFKNLGLLVVDEEQRFGVTHKEAIKKLKETVDVLTLTATPIPRTLHMSMIGIRDMSVLEEAPSERVPIQTYVMEYDAEIVREAIRREIVRGGQVYYVYNRVKNIEEVASNLQKLVPDAVVAYAHGQMTERQLEKMMMAFIDGEIDILVSTTIIETGLDISNVNTIIIHDADRYGLAQLYQLRGRVGRSNRMAYAFILYKRNKILKEEAQKRLEAIREFTELGSGIKIALRDLEIRGTGNLLGEAQHGHMEAVGYELYCKMLREAVSSIKGEGHEGEAFETSLDLKVDAYIPDSYIKNEAVRLDMYKRISVIETEEEKHDLEDELTDRFGDLPKAVEQLLEIALLKAVAHRAFVMDIVGNGAEIKLEMYPRAPLLPDKLPEVLKPYSGRLKFVGGQAPCFMYTEAKLGEKGAAYLLNSVNSLLKSINMLLE